MVTAPMVLRCSTQSQATIPLCLAQTMDTGTFPEFATTCADDDYDKAGSILHEMTHLYGTDDYAYGPTDAKKLSASQAAANADTYEMYSESVRLGGCN